MKLLKKLTALCVMLAVLLVLVFPASADAAKVKINKKKLTIETLQSYTLRITGAKSRVTWSSSNKKVAVVTKDGGMVTGLKVGKTTITAKVGKKKYTCRVTVKKGRSADDEIVVVTGCDSLENKELREFISKMEFKEVTSQDEYTTVYHMTRGQQKEILVKVRELAEAFISKEIPDDVIAIKPNKDFTVYDIPVYEGACMDYGLLLSDLATWGIIYQGYMGIDEKDMKVRIDFYYDGKIFDTSIY